MPEMKPQIAKFLSGGLNLLPPGDLVPEGDAIAFHNWRTDQAGVLRSRKGRGAPWLSTGKYVHSLLLVQAAAQRRYTGAGDRLYRGVTQVATGFDGEPLGLVSFQDRCWVMNRAKQGKDDNNDFLNWTPTAPTAAPTFAPGGASTGGLNGDYSYFVTGVTERNEETNPSPAAAVTGLAENDSVTITAPAFTDPQITRWNVYRRGGTFPTQAYLVNAEPIVATTTTYIDLGTDDQSDDGIADLGVIMRTDRTPAPAARGLAGPYFDKLLAFNSAEHPNRIWWTPSSEPWYFPGSNSEQDGNWVDVGEEGEEIVAIAVFPRLAVVMKERSIHRLVGDPDDWGADIERTHADVGLIGPRAWAIFGSNVAFQMEEGIGVFNLDRVEKLSLKLDPIFKQDTVTTVAAYPASPIKAELSARRTACMAYRNGRLYFSYPDANHTTPNVTIVHSDGRWATDSRGFTALYYEGQGGDLLAGYNGDVIPIEEGNTDNGAAIPLVYQSRFDDQGAPENPKRYSDLVIEHNTGGHTFAVKVYYQNGAGEQTLGTVTSVSRTMTTFPLTETEYRNISVRLEASNAGASYAEFFTLAVHYVVKERNARTYDTGIVALGKVPPPSLLEVDLEILSGEVAYTLYGGISGLTVLQAGTFTGTIRTFTAQLPMAAAAVATDSRWARLVLSGDNFRCHGARLWFHDTGEVVLPKVSLLSALEVDLEIASGSVSYKLYSGRSGLTVLNEGTFAGSVRTFTAALPNGTEARWLRLVLNGDNFICHGARVLLRSYGCYLEGVGDRFRSGDLTGGSPRLKLFSQLRVDCDPDGTIPGAFFSDLPEGAMLERQALSVAPTLGRTSQRTDLPRDTRGKTFRVELTAPAVCRLYGIQVRAKVLGDGASGWQWLDVPVPETPAAFTWTELPGFKSVALPIT